MVHARALCYHSWSPSQTLHHLYPPAPTPVVLFLSSYPSLNMPRCRLPRVLLPLFLLLLIFSTANALNSPALPNPQNDPSNICRRSKPSAICDPDNYLSESDADTIDGVINFIQAGTNGFKKLPCSRSNPTPVGAQLAVAVLHSLPSGLVGTKEAHAFQYAKKLHDLWGVGDPECQNGVVVVFALKDRAMGFSIGEGVNRIFTDAMLPAVMSDMRPILRREEYGKAVIRGVTNIGNILGGGKPPIEGQSGAGGWIVFWFFAVFVGVVVMGRVNAARRRRRYDECKDILKKIDRDRARASNNNYIITSCPICLEDFDSTERASANARTNEHAGEGAVRADTRGSTSADTNESGRVSFISAEENSSTTGTYLSLPNAANDDTVAEVAALPCGHKFHESCILSWFRGNQRANSQCPICRQPIDSSQRVESRTNNGAPSGWDVYDPEYAFRMHRTRHYYPDYLTWTMINDWNRNRYNAGVSMAASAVFACVDPAVIAKPARISGRGGSSFSYSGGSSSRGGGGGGGW